MLNDVYLIGKETDLSAFNADFSEPIDLRISVSQKEIQVYISDEEVYTNTYSESMGRLVGLRFKFAGLGEVIDYELVDQRGDIVQL